MQKILKDIQTVLKSVGLYTGAIDGLIGYGSYGAILKLSAETSRHKQVAREIQKLLIQAKTYFHEVDGSFGPQSITAFNGLIPAPDITEQQLKSIYKNIQPGFATYINQYKDRFNLKNKADVCAFLANTIHESNGFKSLRENMNYSAPRLMQVFPKYFKSMAYAKTIQSGGAIAIADVVYGGRMGNNRNGDGYKYRGGGLMHLTGSDNYKLADIGIGANGKLHQNPEIIMQPEYAVLTAFWFWQKNMCSRPANQGDFNKVCTIINGGTNGLDDRIQLHKKCWNTIA